MSSKNPVSRTIKKFVSPLLFFQKFDFKSGESKQVTFTIDKSDLSFINAQLKPVTEAGEFEVMIGDKKVKFNYQ